MNNNQSIDTNSEEQIKNFVKTSSNYYIKEFKKIGNSSKYVFAFNLNAFFPWITLVQF